MERTGTSVRPLEEKDIAKIVDYFLNADSDFLLKMGVDISKLPKRKEWLDLIQNNHKLSIENKKFYYIIWQLNNKPIGHSNINKIIFGQEAFMHLHLWQPNIRRSGVGLKLLKLTTTPGGTGSGTSAGDTGGKTTTPSTNTMNTTSTNTMNRSGVSDQMNEPDFSQFAQQRMENMLRSLASETGGVSIFNTSDFNGRLNTLSEGLNNYYVLGFQSNNPKRDGKLRRLEVKSETKGVQLRHRESYVDPRPLEA